MFFSIICEQFFLLCSIVIMRKLKKKKCWNGVQGGIVIIKVFFFIINESVMRNCSVFNYFNGVIKEKGLVESFEKMPIVQLLWCVWSHGLSAWPFTAVWYGPADESRKNVVNETESIVNSLMCYQNPECY